MDGFTVWLCHQSGNVLVHITSGEFDKLYAQWEDGKIDHEPSRWVKHAHPVRFDECNGISCKHELILDVKRKQALVLGKDTLDEAQKVIRELDQNQ